MDLKVPKTKILISDALFFLIGLGFFILPYLYTTYIYTSSDKEILFGFLLLFYAPTYYLFILSLKIFVNNFEYLVFFFKNLFNCVYKPKLKEFLILFNFFILLFIAIISIYSFNFYSFREDYNKKWESFCSQRVNWNSAPCVDFYDKSGMSSLNFYNIYYIVFLFLIFLLVLFIPTILRLNAFNSKKALKDWDTSLTESPNYSLKFFIFKYVGLAIILTLLLVLPHLLSIIKFVDLSSQSSINAAINTSSTTRSSSGLNLTFSFIFTFIGAVAYILMSLFSYLKKL